MTKKNTLGMKRVMVTDCYIEKSTVVRDSSKLSGSISINSTKLRFNIGKTVRVLIYVPR